MLVKIVYITYVYKYNFWPINFKEFHYHYSTFKSCFKIKHKLVWSTSYFAHLIGSLVGTAIIVAVNNNVVADSILSALFLSVECFYFAIVCSFIRSCSISEQFFNNHSQTFTFDEKLPSQKIARTTIQSHRAQTFITARPQHCWLKLNLNNRTPRAGSSSAQISPLRFVIDEKSLPFIGCLSAFLFSFHLYATRDEGVSHMR